MMTKKSSSILSLIFLAILSHSCILDSEDENFVEIEKNADPQYISGLEFSHNGNNFYPLSDTVFLEPDATVDFRFDGSGGRVYRIEVAVDDESILQQDNDTEFSVSSEGMPHGVYDLAITQYVKSGTGSLADKIDVEMVGYTASFVLVVRDFTFEPVIKTIELKDGTVNLQWNAYPHTDFQSYEIRRYESATWSSSTHRKFIIADPSQTSFNDTTYVGGWVTYVLYVDRGGEYFTSDENRINFPYKPNMRLAKNAEGGATLSWDRPPFYKNIKLLEVRHSEYANTSDLIAEVPADQTSVDFAFDVPFGDPEDFLLRMTGKVDPPYKTGDIMSVTERLTFGKRTPPLSDVIYNPAEEAYYLAFNPQFYNDYPEGFYRLDRGLNITDTLTYSFSSSNINLIQSPNGNYLYMLHASRIYNLGRNPLLLNGSFHTGDYFDSPDHDYAVSNNNFIMYAHPYTVEVLDYQTKTVLISVDRKGHSHLSADGQYFIHDTDLYKFDGSQYQLLATLPFTDIRFLQFLPDRSALFIATAGKAIVYDFVGQSVVVEYDFATPLSPAPYFNNHTKEYTVRSNVLTTLNIETGEQRVIPVYQTVNSMVEGDYLFSTTGFGLKPY